ncbi:hypothetical protein PIB30_077983 [Stylosanthes scabra]|uniref:Uncharacterized protein n=1 Tax=Stylosanthes scabra TaxID=79078 RepID=A0ABU6YQ59_9FABA|nr:hypothetical protein [Stylosanthes scabra]
MYYLRTLILYFLPSFSLPLQETRSLQADFGADVTGVFGGEFTGENEILAENFFAFHPNQRKLRHLSSLRYVVARLCCPAAAVLGFAVLGYAYGVLLRPFYDDDASNNVPHSFRLTLFVLCDAPISCPSSSTCDNRFRGDELLSDSFSYKEIEIGIMWEVVLGHRGERSRRGDLSGRNQSERT